MSKPVIHLLLLAAFLVAAPAIEAADMHGPMTGIRAVALELEGIEDDFASTGLVRATLEQELARQIQSAGIAVIPASDWVAHPGGALLTFRLRLSRTPYYFYLYNVSLTLYNAVTLASSPGRAFSPVITWTDGWVGEMQPTELAQVNGFAAQLVDRFLAEYRAQNGG